MRAWTDSTIVLNWLRGSPRRFKVFVGNRVSAIIDAIPPCCWYHVDSANNPADCASRGIYPREMVDHKLWWKGPSWLAGPDSHWPRRTFLPDNDPSTEQKELCLISSHQVTESLLPLSRYSTYSRLQRVTAWILRFTQNCQTAKDSRSKRPHLSTTELLRHWLVFVHVNCFPQQLASLLSKHELSRNSVLRWRNPFVDSEGLIRVGGRVSRSQLSYSNIHPVILHGKHPITKLLIQHEHHRLLHATPSLVSTSISLRYHIIGIKKIVRSIIRNCTTCNDTQVNLCFSYRVNSHLSE